VIEKIHIVKKYENDKVVEYDAYFPSLRLKVEAYMDFQKSRIAFENRCRDFKDAGMLSDDDYLDFKEMLSGSEKAMEKAIARQLKGYDVWTEYLSLIKGIGPLSAGYLLSFIGDPERFATISKLWAYAGLGVTDGEATTYKKHGKGSNIRLKTVCWKIGEGFVKTKGKYRTAYEEFRKEDEAKHPEKIKDEKGKTRYNPGHFYIRAKRKTVKLFLAHFWMAWRQMEGLDTSEPYANAIMGHSNFVEPFVDEE